jgi:glyoxylase-like metal-dependent hydrolase (beta-lactamase superfamily II)/rhodanese-related sulfurtransferase
MILKQYYLGCLAHASYLIADERTKVAAVVDPQRDIDQYLADASAQGWTIQYVFLTHFHADFLAGHIELRDRVGAKILLGRRAEAEYEFTPVQDGDVVEFGDVRLTILETPGHTPEGISILVHDLAVSDTKPHAVLTGDTLFIGDVGRPDLLASIGVTADELAEMLHDSITRKLMVLPDETLVYPAHGAGSLCGKQLSERTVSTIGEQKKYNYALQPMSKAEFIKLVEGDQPDAPDYFVFDANRNRKERPALDDSMRSALKGLELAAFLKLREAGARVLDVREGVDFEGAHLEGAINIALGGRYATWCGTLLSHDRPILVVGEPSQEEEAVMRLGRIGFDNVGGYLEGGMSALESRPDLIRKMERITATALAERLAEEDRPFVIDVRAPHEYEGGHIAGAVNLPLNRLADQIHEIPQGRDVVVHCQGGYRSAAAASLLQGQGVARVHDLVGGYKAWVASGLPVENGAAMPK